LDLELVILIGLQASGKTSFRNARFADTHVIVSKDNFRNNRRPERRQRFLIEEALSKGRSVVVDNTNVRREERLALIEQARRHSAGVIGYCFPPALVDSLRRNAQRTGRAFVPEVGIKSMARAWIEPALEEGFDALFKVHLSENGFIVQGWSDTDENG
jgi:predicted kinase